VPAELLGEEAPLEQPPVDGFKRAKGLSGSSWISGLCFSWSGLESDAWLAPGWSATWLAAFFKRSLPASIRLSAVSPEPSGRDIEPARASLPTPNNGSASTKAKPRTNWLTEERTVYNFLEGNDRESAESSRLKAIVIPLVGHLLLIS